MRVHAGVGHKLRARDAAPSPGGKQQKTRGAKTTRQNKTRTCLFCAGYILPLWGTSEGGSIDDKKRLPWYDYSKGHDVFLGMIRYNGWCSIYNGWEEWYVRTARAQHDPTRTYCCTAGRSLTLLVDGSMVDITEAINHCFDIYPLK